MLRKINSFSKWKTAGAWPVPFDSGESSVKYLVDATVTIDLLNIPLNLNPKGMGKVDFEDEFADLVCQFLEKNLRCGETTSESIECSSVNNWVSQE
jgi:hypothetical protein